MKRVTVWAILAENESGEKVVLLKGSREEMRKAWDNITQGASIAQTVEINGEKYLVYGLGSKRTTNPESIKPAAVMLESGLIKA